MTPKPIVRGLYWHVHHDRLVEWCYDYDERKAYIRTEKPKKERALRLKLFQPVKGPLPSRVAKAAAAYDTARTAYDTARAENERAYAARVWVIAEVDKASAALDGTKANFAWKKANVAWEKVSAEYDKARAEYDKATAEDVRANAALIKTITEDDRAIVELRKALDSKAMVALHKKECPTCPWDGKTIFPKSEKEVQA